MELESKKTPLIFASVLAVWLGLLAGSGSKAEASCGTVSGVPGYCTFCWAEFDAQCGIGFPTDACEHEFCQGYIIQECNFCVLYFDRCRPVYRCCWGGGCFVS